MGEVDEGLGVEDADVECSQPEPVNFHSMSFEVYDELLHRSGAKAVVDLTCRVPREVLDGLSRARWPRQVCFAENVFSFAFTRASECHNGNS